jgi:hypothetical protein
MPRGQLLKNATFFEKEELSKCVKYLVRVSERDGLPQSRSFAFIREIGMDMTAKRRSKSIAIYQNFRAPNHGYLGFTVSDWEQSDTARFEAITWDGKHCSIVKGIYVAPFAYSLLRDSEDLVAGILMDTTWQIIRLPEASILTGVTGNVGIPMALSFGPAENTELYKAFYLTFRNLFDLDLSTYIVEPDQGSALRSLYARYHNLHLVCLRHLLVRLGRKPFSWEISNLVRHRCRVDFDRLTERYEALFVTMKAPEDGIPKKSLGKVGLAFSDEKLEAGN